MSLEFTCVCANFKSQRLRATNFSAQVTSKLSSLSLEPQDRRTTSPISTGKQTVDNSNCQIKVKLSLANQTEIQLTLVNAMAASKATLWTTLVAVVVVGTLVAIDAEAKKDYTFLPSIYCPFTSPYVIVNDPSECSAECQKEGHGSSSVKPSYLQEDLVYCCCE